MSRSLADPSDNAGPPTPARRAAQAAEAVRALNHLTIAYAPGYESAADVDQVLAGLRELATRLPQALQQAARWLAAAEAQARLTDVEVPTAQATRTTVTDAIASLTLATGHAASLAADLGRAACATSRLATDVDDEPVPYLPVDEPSVR